MSRFVKSSFMKLSVTYQPLIGFLTVDIDLVKPYFSPEKKRKQHLQKGLKMKVTRTMIIKLSCEEITEIIKDYLSKEGFVVDAKKIDFNVETVWHGYGQGEYSEKEFTGCTVSCEMKTERIDK